MPRKEEWKIHFEIIEQLGKGGNAIVYSVKDKSTNQEMALKVLKKLDNKNKKWEERKGRFVSEIKVMKENATVIPGIMPIIESNEIEYWYTMPIATPILEYIKNKEIIDIVSGVIQVAETLEKLHEKGDYHRDIKPANIYFYNNRFYLGDFGLVDFPDNLNNFTRSDRGLGAIFTIAPEMKRNPDTADGEKADVFSLAKTMWMLLTEDDKGFDGQYNYMDESHSLSYLKKYKNVHLVEIHELLKISTDNDSDKRPNMKEFKKRLQEWIVVYKDFDKSQESDWRFLNKQLFTSNTPESSKWKKIDNIIDILNIVGAIPAYNHMLFPDGGGLDFDYAELAEEEGCIYLYDTIKNCFIIKPKSLNYEGFDEEFMWNYFLLELDELKPIFNLSETTIAEDLVEDTPAHYVSIKDSEYGVYDYDSGEPLPEGYKVVRRYIKGNFLIVVKRGFYNGITSTYDGRHGLCSSLEFRNYIENLKENYNKIYSEAKEHEKSKELEPHELKSIILNLDEFSKNPFKKEYTKVTDDVNDQYKEIQNSKKYVEKNYNRFNFKEILEKDETNSKIKFYFKFSHPNESHKLYYPYDKAKYICQDGYIKEIDKNSAYYVYNREKAIEMRDKLNNYINQILLENNFKSLDEYDKCVSLEFTKCGNPVHLFTKKEIKEEMRNADDRLNNQLVIDEDGRAKVIKNEGYGNLYPVRNETWSAYNNYVGKYSNLSTLNETYIATLEAWLNYLATGQRQYVDYTDLKENDENDLIDKIKEYYE